MIFGSLCVGMGVLDKELVMVYELHYFTGTYTPSFHGNLGISWLFGYLFFEQMHGSTSQKIGIARILQTP